MDSLRYHTSISTMVRGNIILAWQWSGTSIHIYRWPGISLLNIHNGLGHVQYAKVPGHPYMFKDRDDKVLFCSVLQPFFENREPDHRSSSEIMTNQEPDCWFGPKWSGSGSQGVRTRTGPFFISFLSFSL
jgi:hypothetical protein